MVPSAPFLKYRRPPKTESQYALLSQDLHGGNRQSRWLPGRHGIESPPQTPRAQVRIPCESVATRDQLSQPGHREGRDSSGTQGPAGHVSSRHWGRASGTPQRCGLVWILIVSRTGLSKFLPLGGHQASGPKVGWRCIPGHTALTYTLLFLIVTTGR